MGLVVPQANEIQASREGATAEEAAISGEPNSRPHPQTNQRKGSKRRLDGSQTTIHQAFLSSNEKRNNDVATYAIAFQHAQALGSGSSSSSSLSTSSFTSPSLAARDSGDKLQEQAGRYYLSIVM